MGIQSDVRSIFRIGSVVSDKLSRLQEPQRSYLFDFNVFESSANGLIPSELSAYAKTVDLPNISKEPIIHEYMNSKIMYAGRDSSSKTFQATFWDDESLIIMDYMHRWMALSGDIEFGDGITKKDYIKRVDIKLKDVTDLLTTGNIEIYNVFPTELTTTTLSYENSDVLEISMTFAYDYIKFGDFVSNAKDTFNDLLFSSGF